MPPISPGLLALVTLVTSLFGAGLGGRIVWIIMKNKIGEEFVTRKDYERDTLQIAHNTRSIRRMEKAMLVMKTESTMQWATIADHVVKPLQDISTKLERVSAIQAGQSALLKVALKNAGISMGDE